MKCEVCEELHHPAGIYNEEHIIVGWDWHSLKVGSVWKDLSTGDCYTKMADGWEKFQ